jgi:hypothetical protein
MLTMHFVYVVRNIRTLVSQYDLTAAHPMRKSREGWGTHGDGYASKIKSLATRQLPGLCPG